ncbi:MAG: hypothetical protein HY507_00585 [Candidatus Zambryskibacteria bacterium]|nr:hypothetical protein [Candidatus Zambryskibacteria bacterium]
MRDINYCPGCEKRVLADDPDKVLFHERIPMHKFCLKRLEESASERNEMMDIMEHGTNPVIVFVPIRVRV